MSLNVKQLAVLQVLVSTYTSIVVHGIMPLVISAIGYSIKEIGFVFFMGRISAIFASWLAPKINISLNKGYMISVGEIVNAVSLMLIILGFQNESLAIIIIGYTFKCFASGLISYYVFSWLKLNKEVKSDFFSKIRGLTHGGYGLAAFSILLVSSKQVVPVVFLYLDLFASVFISLSIYFFGTRVIAPKENRQNYNNLKSKSIFDFSEILVVDILLAVTICGTNSFLFKHGSMLLGDSYGYFLAMLTYAAAFILVAIFPKSILTKLYNRKFIIVPYLLMLVGLCCLFVNSDYTLSIVGLILILFGYSVANLSMEKIWFSKLEESESFVYGHRLLFIGLILAAGEVLLTQMTNDISLRLVSCFAAVLLLLMASKMPTFNLMEKKNGNYSKS